MNALNGGPQLSNGNGSIHSNLNSNRPSVPRFNQQQPHRSILSQTPGAPPYAVPIVDAFTRSHQLPPGSEFPSVSAEDQLRVKEWMAKDMRYLKESSEQQMKTKAELLKVQERVLYGQDWLGGDGHRGSLNLRTEQKRIELRSQGKIGPNRKELKLSKSQLKEISLRQEVLIPIRVEFEQDTYKLRDTFTWNLTESILTPELFASYLCDDLRLPINIFHREIVSQIRRQIEEAKPILNYDAHLAESMETSKAESRIWFENRAKRRKLDLVEDEVTDQAGMMESLTNESEGKNEELRVVIKLDITLDSIQLIDKFEWDISDPANSPENFAEIFANDLGLGGEFKTAIAHAIREQIEVFVKSLCLLGHVSGLAIGNEDLRGEFLPHLERPFRLDASEFTPVLLQLSPEEVDRNEKERDREARRKRRQTKGRGLTLPDRDPVKTHRTLVPIPSIRPLATSQNSNGDIVYHQAPVSIPYPINPPILGPKPPTIEDFAPISPLKLPILNGKPDRSRKNLKNSSMDQAGSQFGMLERKRAKVSPELLEEAGPRENFIDGNWHCSNCGMPENMTPTKRKGPFGEDTNCNLCGKHFSRNRRNRAVLYSLDLDYHRQLQARVDKGEKFKEVSRSAPRQSPAVPRPVKAIARASKEESSAAESEEEAADSDSSNSSFASSTKSRQNPPARVPNVRGAPRNRTIAASPDLPFVHIGSSESGKSEFAPSPRVPPPPVVTAPRRAAKNAPASYRPPAQQPPQWMRAAAVNLGASQTDDRFEIIPKLKPGDITEWKIRCLDCPGKLYNLGPGETLDNFSVHFKNRIHRENVSARLLLSNPVVV